MTSSAEVTTVAEPLDVPAVRRDFPVLAQRVNGRPLVYLDSAASSQQPEPVIAAVDRYVRTAHANVHRGAHALAEAATTAYEDARASVARFIGAADPDEIVFTRGTTEAINLVAASFGASRLGPEDVVLLTEMEHHSNLVPWQLLAERVGCQLRFIPVTPEGRLDLDALETLLDERVALLAVVHVSNALGTVNPVRRLVEAARAVDARVLLDGAQSVPQRPVDVDALGVDFLAFSGHKLCGPTGIGALWARRELLETMPPYQGGGEMIRRVTLEQSTFAPPPGRFEAGTPAIAPAVGLGAACDYLAALGMDRVAANEARLVRHALDVLPAAVPGLTIHGPTDERGGAITFTVDGVHPHDLATVLDQHGVAIRAGHHCTMPLHNKLGLAATARASVYLYNTPDEIEQLAEALCAARTLFGLD